MASIIGVILISVYGLVLLRCGHQVEAGVMMYVDYGTVVPQGGSHEETWDGVCYIRVTGKTTVYCLQKITPKNKS